jgi:hypothetical protein
MSIEVISDLVGGELLGSIMGVGGGKFLGKVVWLNRAFPNYETWILQCYCTVRVACDCKCA